MRRCPGRMVWFSLVMGACASLSAAEPELTFEQHIRPIFKAHCIRCHGEEESVEGKLDLRLVRLMRQGGDSGPAIVPGNPAQSVLFQRIRDGEMPPEGAQPLSPEQVKRIEAWIATGAKTRQPEPAAVESLGITDDDRAFWAFQPWNSVPPPMPGTREGVHNFVDSFIRSPLDQQKLSPSPEVDRAALLRRVTVSVIGLPPSWEELQEFLSDSSPDAYERLVDRLLASPHYGERWARPWLDMARYVDETPFWVASAGRAWLYRDWVIRAFNEDRPYDDFVRRQLAADLQADVPLTDLAALGFLGLSPTYWKELRLSPDVIKTVVAEEWDERIDAVSRTYLGLTVSCARCHDHKFDPVTMQDYYALAGVMASTQLVDKPQIPYDAAETVRVARQQVEDFQRRLGQMKDQTQPEAASLRSMIARLETSTPHYNDPWVHAVEDNTLIVQPEGADKTRLEYRVGEVTDVPMFRRGNPSNPAGAAVPRRFLTVLCADQPEPFRYGSGRLELADAILTTARPLATRVLVNRIWSHHFGKGIVRTPSDFGRQGEPPTHPELLDALAAGFVEHGWSHKWLHRRLLESAAFRQSSRSRPDGEQLDPENKWLWRMSRRQLEIEPYRDAVLAASGQFNDQMYGPSLPFDDAANLRRTIYGRVVREDQHVMLRLFDFPDAATHSPARDQTTTPLQQLFVLNGPLFLGQSAVAARTLAELGGHEKQRFVESAYRRLFLRMPTDRELQAGQEFLSGDAPGEERRRQAYLQALLGSNEFLFVD